MMKEESTGKMSITRKRLFVSDDTTESAPILHSSDSNSNFSDIQVLDSEVDKEKFIEIFKPKLKDYDIFNENSSICGSPIAIRKSIDSLDISFTISSPASSIKSIPDSVVPTFEKSPTSKLKTPHDTSTVKVNSKQQKRKATSDDLEQSEEINHESKIMKLDASASKSKVRTALFSDCMDLTLPVKSFYPKSPNDLPTKTYNSKLNNSQDLLNKSFSVKNYRSRARRSNNSRKKPYGYAGVRHKIRKPRERKKIKTVPLKSVINATEEKILNGYLKDFAELKKASSIKQIKNIDIEEDKENTAPDVQKFKPKPVENKRIFKSQRDASDEDKSSLQTVPNLNKRKSFTDPYEEDFNSEFNIVNILNTLEEDLTQDPLKNPDLILSPTSQMCDMTSGLAINSPKRGKLNITKLLEAQPNATNVVNSSLDMEQPKLFPIFYSNKQGSYTKQSSVGTHRGAKKLKQLPENQMLLDAGQKKFGMTQCFECGVVYHMGDANDELSHLNYHNATGVLKFHQWKNERVVADLMHSRIIKVIPGDSKIWWKKVKDLMEVVNRDLGYYDKEIIDESNNQVYLYIKNKQIVGCIVACYKTVGYKMLPCEGLDIDMCSEESYAIKCGVSRLWVSRMFRKQGIATAMMNTLRKNFMHGYILQPMDLALSTPTEHGKLFARKYFNTDQFLIYLS